MKYYRIKENHEKKIIIIDEPIPKIIYPKYQSLIDEKTKIDTMDKKDWSNSKKNMNKYEYVYTSANVVKNVCNILPVSRSYYKLHEMIFDYNILHTGNKIACIAEGPGGFIHCINDLNSMVDYNINEIYGITLISKDKKIPFWNKNIIKNPINKISYGHDNTGDIYKLENIESFVEYVGESTCDLVTADGGFDYSNDYNSQENLSYHLLFCEIYTSFRIQKKGGTFIIKFFDLFNHQTIQLLYLLYNHYSIVEFYKPSLSRPSNSEKYIICLDFLGINCDLGKYIDNPDKFFIKIPDSFVKDIFNYNDIFIKEQINSIKRIIENKKISEIPDKEQITIAKRWCELYKLPINKKCIYLK
jgi:23S rRNA U2552 (ribose-2'-O)-methylase RlmE/FtsJ